MAKLVDYNKDLIIRNVDALPRGVGAAYLVVIDGQNGEYVAKRWARVMPKGTISNNPMTAHATWIRFTTR